MCGCVGDCVADNFTDFDAAGLVEEEHLPGRVLPPGGVV